MDDAYYMGLALNEARAALTHGDVPIGAIAVKNSEVLAGAHNERELTRDPTAHAEILVLQRAAHKLKSWRLDGVTLYVTIEPCPMCAGALVWSRIQRLVYGAPDAKAGAALSLYNIPQDPRLNHHVEIVAGFMADECAQVMKSFFGRRRFFKQSL